jgi:hypothetical protein
MKSLKFKKAAINTRSKNCCWTLWFRVLTTVLVGTVIRTSSVGRLSYQRRMRPTAMDKVGAQSEAKYLRELLAFVFCQIL